MGVMGFIKGVGNKIEGGWNQLTSGSDDPSKRRQELQKPYQPKASSFDVTGRGDVKALNQTASTVAGQGLQQSSQAEQNLAAGFRAPQLTPQQRMTLERAGATTTGSTGGLNTAYRAFGDTADSRQAQQNALNMVTQTAQGTGPSVAPGMMRENAAAAAAAMQRAGVGANQAFQGAATNAAMGYGDAAAGAQFAYQDALAQQQAAGQQAATGAGRQMVQGTEDAIRAAAALTAGARGPNMGAALLNAQDNAAFQMAQTNRGASQMQADANMQASQQAAAAQRAAALNAGAQQRQAAAIQAGVNQQAGANLALANIGAIEQQSLGDARAAQLASQEQLQAQGMALDAAGAMRAGDVANVNAALGIGNLGLGQDQLTSNMSLQNAQMANDMNRFNANMGFNYDTQQAQLDAANNALNAQVWGGQAGRGMDAFNSGFGVQQSMTMADIQAAMELERIRSANANAGMDRGQRFDENATDNRTNVLGGLIGAGSSIGAAAILSDEREKDIEGDAEDHDFTRTKSKRYRYKDPKVPGADAREHVGPMAQELPASTVIEGDDGRLRVDTGRLGLALASGLGDIQRRLKALEKKKAA